MISHYEPFRDLRLAMMYQNANPTVNKQDEVLKQRVSDLEKMIYDGGIGNNTTSIGNDGSLKSMSEKISDINVKVKEYKDAFVDEITEQHEKNEEMINSMSENISNLEKLIIELGHGSTVSKDEIQRLENSIVDKMRNLEGYAGDLKTVQASISKLVDDSSRVKQRLSATESLYEEMKKNPETNKSVERDLSIAMKANLMRLPSFDDIMFDKSPGTSRERKTENIFHTICNGAYNTYVKNKNNHKRFVKTAEEMFVKLASNYKKTSVLDIKKREKIIKDFFVRTIALIVKGGGYDLISGVFDIPTDDGSEKISFDQIVTIHGIYKKTIGFFGNDSEYSYNTDYDDVNVFYRANMVYIIIMLNTIRDEIG